MSTTARPEPSLFERVDERPEADPGKLSDLRARDLVYRFIAGALTSAAAGGVTLAFGARTGGVLLAYPAILAASLTLIEDEEDSAHAREDARGAVLGACALALFATVVMLTVRHISPTLSLVLATAAWLAAAVGLYAALWLGRR